MVGELIGNRYEILQEVGGGGFARVFLAKDINLDRHIAIKTPKSEHEEIVSRVVNEAHTLAGLQHPSILTVFDVGKTRYEQPYVVYEYIEGSLKKELGDSPTSLPYERLSEILAQVADALDYIHRRGYLHRNVKPGNILLDITGQPRLTGFEVAILREDIDSEDIVGTAAYMAPEQISEPNQMGPHTDVWGLGVTLYQALTGQLPFGTGGQALFALTKEISLEPLRRVTPSIPQDLERICLNCLSKDPNGRYSTAELLAGDLRAWQPGMRPTERQRVFISHSSKDRQFVEREIIALLERNGVRTWYSKIDIQTAVEWERSILQGLESCDWFLLAMSPRAALSEWVKDELFWAIDNRPKSIIPVLIEDCEPQRFHMRLARLQFVDFRSDLKEARQHLVKIFEESEIAT
jgi:serine/threonine protein kinase